MTLCIGGELNTASKTSLHLAWVTERLQGNLSSSVSARGQGHAGPARPTGTSPRGRPCGLRALRAGLCCLVSGFLSFSDLRPSPSFPIPVLCVKLVVVPKTTDPCARGHIKSHGRKGLAWSSHGLTCPLFSPLSPAAAGQSKVSCRGRDFLRTCASVRVAAEPAGCLGLAGAEVAWASSWRGHCPPGGLGHPLIQCLRVSASLVLTMGRMTLAASQGY